MSLVLSREFPLLPYEPTPQGPTLAHWRDEIAKWWGEAAGALEADSLTVGSGSSAPPTALTIGVESASNQGTVGTGVFKQLSGTDLQFYKLNSTDSKLTIALSGTDRIDFSVNSNAVVSASTDARLSDARTPLAHTHPESDITSLVADLAARALTTDARFTDARTPTAHASTHFSAGSDPIRLDELKGTTDVTTLNSSTSAHGLLKKLNNVATDFMNGQGNWSAGSAFIGGDLPNVTRLTGMTATPSSGEGLELGYDALSGAANAGYITSYSRGSAAYRNLHIDSAALFLDVSGTARAYVDGTRFSVHKDNAIGWTGTTAGGALDTAWYRGATDLIGLQGRTASFPGFKRNAAVMEVKLADDSAYANLKCLGLTLGAPITLKGYTVATLPTGVQGHLAFVTDALAPTFGATVVGGGTVVALVFYNGAAYVTV